MAGVLLLAGGLGALQTASITSALPFAVIILIAAFGMWRALVIEGHQYQSLKTAMRTHRRGVHAGPGYWKKRLAGVVDFPRQTEVREFIEHTVMECFDDVAKELGGKGWNASTHYEKDHVRAILTVQKEHEVDFNYEVRMRAYQRPQFAMSGEQGRNKHESEYYRAEVFLRQGGQAYDLYGYEPNDIINDVINQFENYLQFMHISPASLPWDLQEHDDDLK